MSASMRSTYSASASASVSSCTCACTHRMQASACVHQGQHTRATMDTTHELKRVPGQTHLLLSHRWQQFGVLRLQPSPLGPARR